MSRVLRKGHANQALKLPQAQSNGHTPRPAREGPRLPCQGSSGWDSQGSLTEYSVKSVAIWDTACTCSVEGTQHAGSYPPLSVPPQEMKTVNPLYRRNRDLGAKRPATGRQAPHRSCLMPQVLTPTSWFSLGFYSDLLSFLLGCPCGHCNQQPIFTLGPSSASPPCIFSSLPFPSPIFQECRSSEVIPLFSYNEILKERISHKPDKRFLSRK